MSKITLEIGGLTFSTKGAALEHFQRMMYRYAIGETISDSDATELTWLLERHPEVDDKIGCGVDRFSVRKGLFKTTCFEITRRDGTKTEFSFKTCIEGKRPSDLSEAVRALRAEVAEDILQKKREWFREQGNAEGKVPCAVTGALISIDEAHADHAPPRSFGTIALAFLEARGIVADASFVTPPADNQYQPRIVDRALAEIWRNYHHKMAVIRVVAKKANLSRAHEGKVKRKDRQLHLGNRA